MGLLLDGLKHGVREQIKHVLEEAVRVDGFQVLGLEALRREVLEVSRDDDIGMPQPGRRDDMAVAVVGSRDVGDEPFTVMHAGLGKAGLHGGQPCATDWRAHLV